ncbi:polyprenyl diphosphate synthase [Nocardiopsis lucentensis]|uniref:polyprenyl diphosphate synthase n=1 Tax=Nocardiopsis lucentensis TaxID=53441 RepID=UPI00034D8866|nr:polyprenyl diphosphate synthase [Nocardiopsis lucentensis]
MTDMMEVAGISDPTLRRSFEVCRRVHARRHGSSYATFALLPAQKRPYLHALAAFAGSVDDLADEGPEANRPGAVARWRDTTFRELDTAHSTHSLRRAFVHTVRMWGLDTGLLADHFSALEKDCGGRPDFATFGELREFLLGISGTWAEMAAPLLEPVDGQAPRLMSLVGEVFQMADVLSDLAIDLDRGRCYLPRRDLERFGLTAESLWRRSPGRPHTELIGFEVGRARDLLAEGARAGESVHPSSRPFVSAMTNGLGLWLDEIEHRGGALLRTPLEPPSLPAPRQGGPSSSLLSSLFGLSDPPGPAVRSRPRPSPLGGPRRGRVPGAPVTPKAPPRHVAVIMDGNRRWAAERGRPAVDGHGAGEPALLRSVDAAIECGVGYLTVFMFSTENWSRSREEVTALFDLLSGRIGAFTEHLHGRGVRVRWYGRRDQVRPRLRDETERSETLTADNTRLTLTICLDYGGRQELADAAARAAADAVAGRIDPADLTQDGFARYLYDPELPDVDLLLRTSGEQRTSNFLPWHTAYAEIVFDDVLWPDFEGAHLRRAIDAYTGRRRRFGADTVEEARRHAPGS